MTETKKCSRCGIVKQVSKFHKDRHHSTGYRSQCKICRNLPKLKPNPKYCPICVKICKEQGEPVDEQHELMHKSWGTFCGAGHYKGKDF